MILVGEVHEELPLASLIQSLGLSSKVRHIDFAPIEDFNGYLGGCDIVLNLRFPTVGESSGTLLRSLGMGKGGDRERRGIVPRISGRGLPQGAGGRDGRGSSFRVHESAGVASGSGAGVGRAGAGVGGARVQLGFGRPAGIWIF